MGRTIVITGASDGIGAAAAARLKRSGENAVVVGRSPEKTAAVAGRLGAVDIDDLDARRGYRASKAYGDAKLENILFTRELHRRHHGEGLSTAAFHPGNVASNFGSEAAAWWIRAAYRTPMRHLVLMGPERGSDELVWLASATPGMDWVSGENYVNHKVARANPRAHDPVLARELWDRSLAMVCP